MKLRVRLLSSLFVVMSVWCAVGAANALTIYARFPVPGNMDSWEHDSLTLAPDAWLVAPTAADIGSPSGAPASVAQIQSVLGNLGSMEIGGVCTSPTSGATIYPCNMALDNVDLAGLALEGFSSLNGWTGTENRVTRGINWSSSGGNPGGMASISPFNGGTELLTLVAPSAFLGNKSAAYGGTLSFDFRTSSNPYAVESYSYGIAILATPEPATGVLTLGGLCVLGWCMRRARLSACE